MSEQFLIWLADTAPGHSKRTEVSLASPWWAEKCNRVGKSQLVSLRQLGCSWFSTVVPRSIENPIFGELRKNCWVNCSSILSLHIGLLPNACNYRNWMIHLTHISNRTIKTTNCVKDLRSKVSTWHINSIGSVFNFSICSSSPRMDSNLIVLDPWSTPSISIRTPARVDSEKQEPIY